MFKDFILTHFEMRYNCLALIILLCSSINSLPYSDTIAPQQRFAYAPRSISGNMNGYAYLSSRAAANSQPSYMVNSLNAPQSLKPPSNSVPSAFVPQLYPTTVNNQAVYIDYMTFWLATQGDYSASVLQDDGSYWVLLPDGSPGIYVPTATPTTTFIISTPSLSTTPTPNVVTIHLDKVVMTHL